MKKVFSLKFLTVILLASLILALAIAFAPSGIAEAVLPEKYVDDVVNSLYFDQIDWWTYSYALDLPVLKLNVASWFTDSTYDFSGLETDPIVVAVIDSGVNYNHELFLGDYDENGTRISLGSGEYDVMYRMSGNVVKKNAIDGALDDQDVTDEGGHGTHVAGIIAILIHELNLEKYIKIMPVKSGADTSDTRDIKRGLEFAVSNGADVINLSLGGESSASHDSQFIRAHANDAVYIAAAGNESKSSDTNPSYPAALDEVVGVMSYVTGRYAGRPAYDIQMADYSNYGDCYDIVAPGTKIYSADFESQDEYIASHGTSMASPVAAFVAALMLVQKHATGVTGTEANAQTTYALKNAPAGTQTLKGPDNESYPVLNASALIGGKTRGVTLTLDESKRTQTIGFVENVEISASVYPASDQSEGTIKWYLDGTLQSDVTGYTYDCAVPSTRGGHTVKAVWTSKYGIEYQKETTLTVIPYTITQEMADSFTIKFMNTDQEIVTGGYARAFYLCILEGIQDVPEEVVSGFTWYLDGNKLLLSEGSTYFFNPTEDKSYAFKVQVAGTSSNPVFTREFTFESELIDRSFSATVTSGSISQSLDALEEITVVATSESAIGDETSGEVIWRLNDALLKKGPASDPASFTHTFTLPKTAGTHELNVTWSYDEVCLPYEEIITFTTTYMHLNADAFEGMGLIAVNSIGNEVTKGEVDEKYSITLDYMYAIDPQILSEHGVKWYVDGVQIGVPRPVLEWTPTAAKSYTIKAVLGSLNSKEFTFEVEQIEHTIDITIDGNSTEYTVGYVPAEIRMDAVLTPADEYAGIEWYINGVRCQDAQHQNVEGQWLSVTFGNTAGTYTVKAIWKFSEVRPAVEVEKTITVKYLEVTAENIGDMEFVITDGDSGEQVTTCKANVQYSLSVASSKSFSAEVRSGIEWYVNGKLYHTGETFSFTLQDKGTYKVQAKINGIEAKEFNIVVGATEHDKLFIMIGIIGGSVGGAILLAIVLAVVYKARKDKKLGY